MARSRAALVFVVAVAALLALAGCQKGDAGAGSQEGVAAPNPLVQPPGTSKYGGREPRTCTDRKAPAEGAITADLATA